MNKMKSFLLGLVTIGAFAFVALGATAPASAQMQIGDCNVDSDCPLYPHEFCYYGSCMPAECTTDSDCWPGEICDGGTCVAGSVCDAGSLGLSNYNKTVAAIPNSSNVVVGNRIAISQQYQNTSSSYSCSYEAGCNMNYRSNAKHTNGVCGGGEGCFAEDSTKSSQFEIYHSHLMGQASGAYSGKYTITAILGTCNSTGRKIVELTKCNC